MHQEKYKSQSKLNHKLVKQQEKKLENDTEEKVIKIPKNKKKQLNFRGTPNFTTSGISRKRIRRNDLAPMPKDAKKSETKIFNKRKKIHNLSFDDE